MDYYYFKQRFGLFIWIFYVLVLYSTTVTLVQSVKVSFYGASHIAMPLQEAKISTNIRLRFRTQQLNALLLLAAGRTDFCSLGLEAGRLKFAFKIDDYMTELWSPDNILYSDLQWHDVAIQRYDSNVTFQIDEHFVRKTLPVQVNEFNIHFGVFLGGLGDFSESYLSSQVDNFRGCISDVYYNNINVFKRAKERTSHVESVDVTWNCSGEFDATETDGISFIDDIAYTVLTRPIAQTGETWNLELRTIETVATILYNNGPDFVGLEIVDAKLRLLIGKGSNAVELVPDRNISDGKWHNVTISYSPANVELILDDSSQSATFANGSSQIMELGEEYYFGGIIDSRKRKANQKGLRSVDQSFRGCMKNLMVSGQHVGFPQMKITHGVGLNCVWNYPCLEKTPCIMSSICQQYGVNDFNCYCDQAYCIKADYTDGYKVFSRSELPIEIEILSINPLQVVEGESIFLSTQFIEVLIDYKKLHIHDSGVVFNIVQIPKHGRISILPYVNEDSIIGSGGLAVATNISTNTHQRYFSLVDLNTDKIKYTHNGHEHFTDHMTIDMQLMSNGREPLPEFIQGKHRFVLHVNVTPINDPPVLVVPNNRILRLTQGIPKTIRPDFLLAEDPDSSASALMYSIVIIPNTMLPSPPSLVSLPSASSSALSYDTLINIQTEVSGKSVTTFSQEQVNQGLVTFMVNTQNIEDLSFEISCQVSDGIETSHATRIPVSVMPLQLRMINNTGLVLVHKSAMLISPWNLSFVSNSDDDSIDVKYTIVQTPLFGSLQKFRTVDSSWITVEAFTSDQILLGHIRYIHNTDSPVHDEFKFVASYGPFRTIKYDFRITFTKLKIGVQVSNSLQINGTQETIILPFHLFHQTTPLPSYPRSIIYTVIGPPLYGQIFVNGHPEYAKQMDSFTQQDLDNELIIYKTHHSCYSSFIDFLEFTVSVPECNDVSGTLQIIYNPPEYLAASLAYQTMDRIDLREGEKALISRRNFHVLFNKFNYLLFKASTPPAHGELCKYDPRSLKHKKIETFTLENLYLDDIFYCHDDSESTKDSIDFLVLSDDETDFQFICQIQLFIEPVNDNGPYRLSDGIFYVVRNDSKWLTPDELKYEDLDINTNETSIVYSSVTASNGRFYKSGEVSDTFTQDDISHGRILFEHATEMENGSVSFVVTDGLYNVPGELRIQASDPFIKISEKNASVVQEGKFIVLTTDDLLFETNINARSDEVEFQILNDPSYGALKIQRRKFNGTLRSNNITSIKNFTQYDVERERLIYINTAVASMDKIRYRISIKDVWAESDILIRIYPSAYWDLLQIRRNQTLFVEESTSVKISRDILEIIHPNISPGDITYLVTSSPQHGYLEIQSITSDDEYNCKVFDQSTINSEKMFYIQAGVNQSSDHFVFDVTNGITWLRGLVLKIIIIPENLYIQTQNVSVEEGKILKLEPSFMVPYSEYYNGKILEFKIVQQPTFGDLRSGKSKVNRFTYKQLESGQVQYIHDGSENSTDLLRLIAIARNKESVQFDLGIEIIPVNDEIPQIVTNTGLQIWIGGRTILKKSDLMAQDYDTPAEDLTFIISDVTGGSQLLKKPDNISITRFTQHDIDMDQIVFIHNSTGQINGQVNFVITDGEHTSSNQVLYITTNPVTLELIKNENLHVFPLTRKQITSEQLQFRCSDNDREIKFVITIAPQSGRILYEFLKNGTVIEITEFTQHDVNTGRILYEHTHTMVELKSNDSFYFDVTARLANSLIDQIFNVEISVSSGGLLRFLPVPRLYLNEGDIAPIRLDLSKVLEYLETRAGIQSPELYIDALPTEHGQIEMIASTVSSSIPSPTPPPHRITTGGPFGISSISRFMLNDFNDGRVFYHHDHSDTIEDNIFMSVYLTQGNIFLCNLTLPVIINPVNDHPFTLITQSPQMSVVEGENRTITNKELLTRDIDTGPNNLIYDIISGPTLGALIKISDEGVPHDILTYGNQFSQLDINDGRIQYVHYGIPQATSFYFKVSDGKFKPSYEIFNLRIVPVQLSAGLENEVVSMQQGSNLAQIESKHMSIETNAQRWRLIYNVTEKPTNGYILVDNRAMNRFTHAQLDNHQVQYIQTDMNKSSDSFQVTIYIPEINNTVPVVFEVKIIVEPFITINGISISSSDRIRLTSTVVMDNPTQTKLNRYNPKITITRRPEHGRIRKIIRTSGDAEHLNDKDVNSFTYKELKSGIVYFVARELPNEVASINDYFEYILNIKSVQPGQGFVPIEIHKINNKNYGNNLNNGIADGGNSNGNTDYGNGHHSSNDGGVDILTYESFSFNYIAMISIITIMIVIGLFLILLIKCRSDRRHGNGGGNCKMDGKDYPPTLPRPPDFMSLNNNRIYSSNSEGGESMPVTASSTPLPVLSSIPHCKVIPIGDLEDSESDDMIDLNMNEEQQHLSRYPYGSGDGGGGGGGVDDNDEWSSSCDVGQDVSYSTIPQSQIQHQQHQQQQHQQQLQPMLNNNPLLRRNQYWV